MSTTQGRTLLSRWSLFLFTTHAQLFLFIPFSLISLIPFICITFLFLLLYYHHIPSFYFSSYDSHQATGRQDCYCTLEQRPTTPNSDAKDLLHSQRPSYLVPQDCENYAVVPLFFLNFSLFIARPPVLGMMLNCIIMPHDYYDNTWHVLMVKIPCIGYNS